MGTIWSERVNDSFMEMAGMVLILRGVNNDSFMANNYMFNFLLTVVSTVVNNESLEL